ncbi:MAG: hypothetical protein HY040_02455 [Planctomycetes bacterium]|nr:hypothetical protein [Planctomycetota bacterium]
MKKKPKQGPPWQFRPGPDLEDSVKMFAAENGLQPGLATKILVALAVTGMDRRYYRLVNKMAAALAGRNSFVRACVHIQTALTTAERVLDQRTQFEPQRSRFIYQTVKDFLSFRGIQLDKRGLNLWPQDEKSEQGGGADQQAPSADITEQVIEEHLEPPASAPRIRRHVLLLQDHAEDTPGGGGGVTHG